MSKDGWDLILVLDSVIDDRQKVWLRIVWAECWD